MNQTPTIIKVPSVYEVKLPHGEWINLATVSCVEVESEADSLVPDINFVIVRLTFDTGRTKTYSGAKAAAIKDSPNRNGIH